MRPRDSEEIRTEDWLNVFVLHQNRVQHGASAKNCLQERHLPAFMDLVIWGHEHECIPEPQVCFTFVSFCCLLVDAAAEVLRSRQNKLAIPLPRRYAYYVALHAFIVLFFVHHDFHIAALLLFVLFCLPQALQAPDNTGTLKRPTSFS
jgi:hypothetical protein